MPSKTWILAGLITLVLCAVTIVADAYTVSDSKKVYWGEPDGASKAGEVSAADVFGRIPEYREIFERELTPEDPEFYILLNKANRKFQKAVAKVGNNEGYDVIAEKGSLEADEGEDEPTDLTQAVIDAL